MTRELLGAAATLTGNVLAVTVEHPDTARARCRGAPTRSCTSTARTSKRMWRGAVVTLMQTELPAIILAPSTAWGREVASRVAARLGAGLTGDAVELEVDEQFRLVAWKPAFGGQLVAAIGCTSLAPDRDGARGRAPDAHAAATRRPSGRTRRSRSPHSGRVESWRARATTTSTCSAEAEAVIGVGMGVAPDALRRGSNRCATLLGAELAATRKVTDKGWLPRARQIGITGRSIAPRLFVSVGASGKFNHIVGVRAARTVLAINPDPAAPVFDHADVGIVGDWRDVRARCLVARSPS